MFLEMRKLINFPLRLQRCRKTGRGKKTLSFPFHFSVIRLCVSNSLYQLCIIISCLIKTTTAFNTSIWSYFLYHNDISASNFIRSPSHLLLRVLFHIFHPTKFSCTPNLLSQYVLLANPTRFPRLYLPLHIHPKSPRTYQNPTRNYAEAWD